MESHTPMNSRLKTVLVTFSALLVALLLMGTVLGKNSSGDGAYRQLAVYSEVLSRIKSDYVEEPDLKSVTLGAVNGLLESIDPFASYLNAEQYKEYLKNKDSQKGQVGLILAKRFGTVGVVDAIPGSPGAKAGLTTNDMIESIHGVGTRDMPLAYAYMLLGGKPGTTIDVSVLSPTKNPEPRTITLTRAVVQYPKVTSKMLPGEIGYIGVESMNAGTADQVSAAVKSLEKEGAKKLLLDLRHCASGTPEEGVAVANLFQNEGLLAWVQGQRVSRQDFKADPYKAITKLPLTVMTNRGTASGAEVAAAALLDRHRAEVVGERTYGDASVRQAISMEDGGAIILSVAKYFSPSGKAIQDTGVTPTVQVVDVETSPDLDDDNAPEAPAPEAKPGEDPILKKAIEVATKGAGQTVQAPSGAPQDRTMTPQNQTNPEKMHVPAPEH